MTRYGTVSVSLFVGFPIHAFSGQSVSSVATYTRRPEEWESDLLDSTTYISGWHLLQALLHAAGEPNRGAWRHRSLVRCFGYPRRLRCGPSACRLNYSISYLRV